MNTEKNSKIDILLGEINKRFGDNTISRIRDLKTLDIQHIPSGSFSLDLAMGKGFPAGRIIELFGAQSAGKSLICALTVAQVQKLGGDCVWIDAENAFDPSFAKKLGVDVDKLIITQISYGESIFDLMLKLLAAEPALIVVDSVAAMVPKADMERAMDEPTMGTHARLMSLGLRKLVATNKHTTILFINQVRASMNMYGPSQVTTGGRTLGFAASVRVEIKQGDPIEDPQKVRIGQVVKFRIVKNKVAPPYREGYFKFLYEGKIDTADEMVSLALLQRKIEPKGAWYEVLGKKIQGREALEEALRGDKIFFDEFKKMIE